MRSPTTTQVDELSKLFRFGFVCIRRFRSQDGRLLPLVLDPPRLLKYHAAPSDLALQVGLQMVPKEGVPEQPTTCDAAAITTEGAACRVTTDGAEASAVPSGQLAPPVAGEDLDYDAALRRGLRLFAVYVDAGGALCMRQTVWRRVMSVLHPDRGGHVRVFQLLGVLKRQLDASESVELPPMPPMAGTATQADIDADVLEKRLREEMRMAAGDDALTPSI